MTYCHKNQKGQDYFLHRRHVTLRGGRDQIIYFFAREVKDGALEDLPEGYQVVENQRTGLPLLKKEVVA